MIIQNRTISVVLTCTQEQTRKKQQNLNITNSIEVTITGVAKGGLKGPAPPASPHRNATNGKNVTKKSCCFIFSVF